MRKAILLLSVFLALLTIFCLSLINPVIAVTVEDEAWSMDDTAYSLVRGAYYAIGYPYTAEYHYGQIWEGGIYRTPYTRFTGWDQYGETVYDDIYVLTPYSNYSRYYDVDVWTLGTTTDSGYSWDAGSSTATAFLGPPGTV